MLTFDYGIVRNPEIFQPRGELRAAGEEVPLSDGTVKLNIQAENDFSLILTGRSSKTILSVDYQAGRGFLLYGIEKSRQIMDLRSAENLEILYDREFWNCLQSRTSPFWWRILQKNGEKYRRRCAFSPESISMCRCPSCRSKE